MPEGYNSHLLFNQKFSLIMEKHMYMRCARVYPRTAHDTHVFQVTICSHSTDDALHSFYADTVNQMCNV